MQGGRSKKAAQFALSFQPSQLLPSLTSGLIAGVLTILIEISFAALIFDGELSLFVSNGIGFTLFGAFTVLIVTTLTSSFPGIVAVPQDIPVVLLALVAAGIAGSMPAGATAEDTYYTVVAAIIFTSLVAGIFFFFLGVFRLGRFIRFIPYPVIGGFLAGTGWLLVIGAIEVMTDLSITFSGLSSLFTSQMLLKWVPGIIFAVLLLIVLRRSSSFMIMPVMIFIAIGIFYLISGLTGTSISEASAGGWLLGPFPGGRLWRPVTLAYLSRVHWLSIWQQLGNIGMIVVISVISLLLNISGVELIAQQDMDLNRELKVAGFANLAAGLGGSPAGYHTLSLSALALKIGANSRIVGIFAALFCGIALWFGASVFSLFPKPVLGGLLLFLGASFVVEWLYDAWFRLSKTDYFLVILIFLVIVVFGFLEGVAVGILAAVLLFIVNYSQIEVINQILSGSAMQSNVSRSDEERHVLREKGEQIYIVKLQGYIFFGTAYTLFRTVQRRVYEESLPPPRSIIFDFHRVRGLDGSAEFSFIRIMRLTDSHNIKMAFTGLAQGFKKQLERARAKKFDIKEVHFFPDLDHGLEWCEDQILLTEGRRTSEERGLLQKQLRSILPQSDQVETIMNYLEKREVESGYCLIHQGDPAEDLYFIESGEFAALLEIEGEEPIRLRTMRAGVIFGEIALYLKIPRSLSVVATQPSKLYCLSATALRLMEKNEPSLTMAFQNYLIRLLAERLVDLNRTLRALYT